MDISSCPDNSEAKDVSSVQRLLSSSKENPTTGCADDPVIELGNTLAHTLHIERVDVQEQAHCHANACLHIGDQRKSEDFELPNKGDQSKSANKFLNKCASFPCPPDKEDAEHQTKMKGLSSHEEPLRSAYARSISLPSPLNLVSAMKGGREKHGAVPRKLSVSWAPDVYDPTPTSLSHTVRGGGGGGGGGKKQQKSKNNRKNWKNGKKGQKGNSSRGGSGKDKKQSRKVSGSSNGCYRSMDTRETLTELRDEFDDLTMGGPDSQSYCGTSFLKKSLANMHYSVAEAL